MALIEFSYTLVRGDRSFDLDVFADNFSSDPDVGWDLCPEDLWATHDGREFELTEPEWHTLAVLANERYDNLDDPADMADLREF